MQGGKKKVKESTESYPFEPSNKSSKGGEEGEEIIIPWKEPALSKFASLVILLLLAIAVSWGVVSFRAIPKAAYIADITRLELDLVSARGEIESLQGLEARVMLLEANETNEATPLPTPTAQPPGSVDIVIEQDRPPRYGTFCTSYQMPISLTISNNTSQDVEDIEIGAIIHSGGMPISFYNAEVTGSYPLLWQVSHQGEGAIALEGVTPPYAGGLGLEVGESRTIFITAILRAVPISTQAGVPLYIETEIRSYTPQ